MSIERIKQNIRGIVEAVYSKSDKEDVKKTVLKLSSDIHKLVEEEKKKYE